MYILSASLEMNFIADLIQLIGSTRSKFDVCPKGRS